MFLTFLFRSAPKKVCIANQNIGQKFVLLKSIYFSYSSFVVYSIKLVTSAVGISLPSIFCIPKKSPSLKVGTVFFPVTNR